MRDKRGRQVGKIMRPKALIQSGKTSVGDKWKTSVNSCGSKAPRVGDKRGKTSGGQV